MEKLWKIIYDVKISIYIPACRIFLINFHRKIIKNHWFSSKKHENSLIFMKSDEKSYLTWKFQFTCRRIEFFESIFIQKSSKIIDFHRKNMKIHWFSWKVMKNHIWRENFNLHTGVSIFCNQFSSKNARIVVRARVSTRASYAPLRPLVLSRFVKDTYKVCFIGSPLRS